MLVESDLPGEWRTTEGPARSDTSIPDSAVLESECGEATSHVAEEASRWAEADVAAKMAWKSPGDDLTLKQEIAADRHLDAGHLVALLVRQANQCSDILMVADGTTVESHLRSCNLSGGLRGVQIVQTWAASDGRSGSTRLAYVIAGHALIVMTLTAAHDSSTCGHAVFDRVVTAAAAKLA